MRKGVMGPMMYILLALMLLAALVVIILSMRDKSFSLIGMIKGVLS